MLLMNLVSVQAEKAETMEYIHSEIRVVRDATQIIGWGYWVL